MTNNKTCVTCDAALHGLYCHECGERVVEAKDFSLRKILGDGLDAFTNLDSKVFKSFKRLIFKPGTLTEAYYIGQRKDYLKPFQIFILTNIFFFIFLSQLDLFLIPSKWFIVKDFEIFNFDIEGTAQNIADRREQSLHEIKLIYDQKIAATSKLFMVLLVPALAAISYPIAYKKLPEYGKHIILALHLLSFFFILAVCYTKLFSLLPIELESSYFTIPISSIFTIYTILTFKRLFNESIWLSIVKGLYFFIFLFVAIFIYRFLVSYYTLISL